MFSKFLSRFKILAKERPPSPEEKRYYDRFNIGYPGLCYFISPKSSQRFAIVNLGYGGITAEANDWHVLDATTTLEVELMFHKTEGKAYLIKVYEAGEKRGFRFDHKDANTLILLRPVIENFRVGATLRELKKAILKDPYNQDDWYCLRGEGPTDLLIRKDELGDLNEFLFTFRIGQSYRDIRLKERVIYTGHSIDEGGLGTRMETDPVLNPATINEGIQILLGIVDPKVASQAHLVLETIANHTLQR